MGQLEKYGLYVLCLVIFLILGVTIWGGGDVQAGKTPPASIRAPSGTTGAPPNGNAGNAGTVGKDAHVRSLAETLLEPAPTDKGGPRSSGPSKEGGPAKDGGKANPPANDPPKSDPKSDVKADPKADAKTVAYKVMDGDTYESIARAKLGKPGLWTEIQKLNPDVKPDKLHPGQEIKLPTAAALAANTPAATPKTATDKPVVPAPDGSRTYVVVKGDNYERIAQNELGKKSRAAEVMDLNPGIEATKLKPGMSIKLPKK